MILKHLTAHIADAFLKHPEVSVAVTSWGHDYVIQQPDDSVICAIEFQNGPIKEAGMNGVTTESLLAICKDRLEHFQNGAYACKANQQAIDGIDAALAALHARTRERAQRAVEGTMGL